MFHHIVSYRRTLVLTLCTILVLETHADSSICKICTCNSLQVNCENRNLTSIPQPIPTNIVDLYLNYNNITTIKLNTFMGLSNLQYLNLRSNNIATIEPDTFKGLSNLQRLDLNSNNIATIEPDTFKGLSNLQDLNLLSNNIATIEPDAFTGLSNLQRLNLLSNNIATIEPDAFKGLSNLQELNLHSNNIATIEPDTFKGLSNLQRLDLAFNNIATIEPDTFTGLSNLQYLYLNSNNIATIKADSFSGLSNLQELNLRSNNIATIKPGTFTGLSNLQTLDLLSNNIATIEPGTFMGLSNLQTLDLDFNNISTIEQDTFTGLSNLQRFYLQQNNLMRCGCHLPAFVNHVKKVYNRTVNVHGTCLESSEKHIPILNYSQCQNYSLFQRNLQCQTCSGMMCNDSEVESCPGSEPVCRFALSMDGVKLKTEKTCSTYRKCVEAMRNNTLTCNKWNKSRFCVGCCVGHLCNKNDFIGWTNSFVFRLILNEYAIPAENISRAMEHELLTVTGTFSVEYCGANRNEIFAIYCTVFSEMTESQLRRNISQLLNKSQALRSLGVQQSHMEFIDEMVCDESKTSANNRTFSWPITKVGTTAEIPCHAHVATRYCSPKTVGHPEIASSQNMSSQKCSPFTGIWQEANMSQCYNTEQTTQGLKDIGSEGIDEGWTNSFVFRLIFKKLNEYTIPAENISRAMENEFLTVTGRFRVEYSGSNRSKIFAIYCTVFSEMTESELLRNISQVLNNSKALRNLGVQQSHMEFIDESPSTGNGIEDKTADANL